MADIGDWLLVRARTDHLHSRRGRIMEIRGGKGGPPYLVQWADTGAQALVFPGPDAQVMTEAELQVLDQQQNQRIGRVQEEIRAAQHAASSRR